MNTEKRIAIASALFCALCFSALAWAAETGNNWDCPKLKKWDSQQMRCVPETWARLLAPNGTEAF